MNGKMEISILDNGIKINLMGKEERLGLMEIAIKDIGKWDRQREVGILFIKMELCTKEVL